MKHIFVIASLAAALSAAAVEVDGVAARVGTETILRSDVANEMRRMGLQDPSGSAPSLRGFLEEVALVADIDSLDDESDRVPLMTLHSAKGLEFGNVYLAGMDEGLFPGYQSIGSGDESDIEEERRLCYVGITRAKRRLTLTGARMRILNGRPDWYSESRFLDELGTIGEREASGRSQSGRSGGYGSGGSGGYGAGGSGGYGRSGAGRGPAAAPKPFFLKQDTRPVTDGALDYGIGDTVRHVKFGTGVVKDIRDGGRDHEVTVEFEKFGVKKMFAGFAKLKKL